MSIAEQLLTTKLVELFDEFKQENITLTELEQKIVQVISPQESP